MGRVWLGTPPSTTVAATATTELPDCDLPRPFDQRDVDAIARLSAPLRAQPAQQHGQRDDTDRSRRWWQRLFRR